MDSAAERGKAVSAHRALPTLERSEPTLHGVVRATVRDIVRSYAGEFAAVASLLHTIDDIDTLDIDSCLVCATAI